MEVFLLLNGYGIQANVDVQEKLILDLDAGRLEWENLTIWVKNTSSLHQL